MATQLENVTQLEALIRQQTTASVVTSISHAIDKIAEEMAREMLQDPLFRKELQRAIGHQVVDTIKELRKRRRAKFKGRR